MESTYGVASGFTSTPVEKTERMHIVRQTRPSL